MKKLLINGVCLASILTFNNYIYAAPTGGVAHPPTPATICLKQGDACDRREPNQCCPPLTCSGGGFDFKCDTAKGPTTHPVGSLK